MIMLIKNSNLGWLFIKFFFLLHELFLSPFKKTHNIKDKKIETFDEDLDLLWKNSKQNNSFIAVRNLTIDKAPTSPNDKARDDFTIVIINIVVIATYIKLLEVTFLSENPFPSFVYVYASNPESIAVISILIIKSVRETCMFWFNMKSSSVIFKYIQLFLIYSLRI